MELLATALLLIAAIAMFLMMLTLGKKD